MSILIVATHGIGDVILTCQSVFYLRQENVNFLVSSKKEKEIVDFVFKDFPNVKCKAISDFWGFKFIKFLCLVLWIRKKKITHAICQYGVSSFLFSILVFLGGVTFRFGWYGPFSFLNTRSLKYTGLHKVLEGRRLACLVLEPEVAPSFPNLAETGERKKPARDLVVLGPNAFEGELHKRWPIEKYSELCREIFKNFDVDIEILGSVDEFGYCQKIVDSVRDPRIFNRCGDFSIVQSIERLSAARIAISNCNAISHMASLADVPIVGIYGPTDYGLTGPYSDRLHPVTDGLPCSPCYRRGYTTGCGVPKCLLDLDVKKVFFAVKKVLMSDGQF